MSAEARLTIAGIFSRAMDAVSLCSTLRLVMRFIPVIEFDILQFALVGGGSNAIRQGQMTRRTMASWSPRHRHAITLECAAPVPTQTPASRQPDSIYGTT
jgi:hypothetical protein